MKRKRETPLEAHINKLFNEINGGDDVDSAQEAHDIAVTLLAAVVTAKELLDDARLVMDKDRETNLREWMPMIVNAIAKAKGEIK